MGLLTNEETAARLTVIERAIVDLAALVETLKRDLLDADLSDVLGSMHDD